MGNSGWKCTSLIACVITFKNWLRVNLIEKCWNNVPFCELTKRWVNLATSPKRFMRALRVMVGLCQVVLWVLLKCWTKWPNANNVLTGFSSKAKYYDKSFFLHSKNFLIQKNEKDIPGPSTAPVVNVIKLVLQPLAPQYNKPESNVTSIKLGFKYLSATNTRPPCRSVKIAKVF